MKRSLGVLILFALGLALALCGSRAAEPVKDSATVDYDPQPWTVDEVEGLQIDLIHPTLLEWMSFHRMNEIGKGYGVLSITYGTKTEFTGPARLWRLEDGKLVIFKNKEEEFNRFTLLSLTEDILIVQRRNGEISRHQVQRHGALAPGKKKAAAAKPAR